MALDLPVFLKRTGSAIVFAIIMLGGLLWNEWAFLALMCLIQVLCLREYFRLMKKIFPDTYWPSWLPAIIQIAGLIITVPVIFSYDPLGSNLNQWITTIWFILPLAPALLIVAAIVPEKNFFLAFLISMGGILQIVLPVFLFLHMRMISILIPLALVLMIWMNDTMAYITGSLIGKTPFWHVSPKKTWEGTIGGVIFTIAGAAIWGYNTHYYRMADWMALAVCAAVAGTFGDMVESKMKRLADVKDSGSLMPGHGGALDRFDSLLIAIPFAFCYVIAFMEPLYVVIF